MVGNIACSWSNLVLFGQTGCIRAKLVYSVKLVVFDNRACNSSKVVLFGQVGCIWAKLAVFGQIG